MSLLSESVLYVTLRQVALFKLQTHSVCPDSVGFPNQVLRQNGDGRFVKKDVQKHGTQDVAKDVAKVSAMVAPSVSLVACAARCGSAWLTKRGRHRACLAASTGAAAARSSS